MKILKGLLLYLVLSLPCLANSDTGLPDGLPIERLEQLSSISFHPAFLPIILRNRDFIGLTDAQVEVFRTWHRENYEEMVAVMNEIIRKRTNFRKLTISPSVSADDLRALQQDIFRLQMRVLSIRLACRENIMKVFSKDNWDAFLIVLANEGFEIPDDAEEVALLKLSGIQKGQ